MLPATHQKFKAVTELGTVESSCRSVQWRYEVQKSVKHDLSCHRTSKAIMMQNSIKIIVHSLEKYFLAFSYKGLFLSVHSRSLLCVWILSTVLLGFALLLNFLCYGILNMCLFSGFVTS